MTWHDFFRIVYHPAPGQYFAHWKDTSKPVDNTPDFYNMAAANLWIEKRWQTLLTEHFEKICLK